MAQPGTPAHLDKLAEAKVSKLGIGCSRVDASQQHVLQLEVSMHHHGPEAVEVLECCGNLVQPSQGIQPGVCGCHWAGVAGKHLVQHVHLET